VSLFDDSHLGLRLKVTGLGAALMAANLAAWGWALTAFHGSGVLLGTALLAYGLGLRHAVDADHIAAIDNVTRKLMQEGKQPIGVGFFFALGHSTVVVVAAAAIALTESTLQERYPALVAVGGVIGTGVSAGFLFLIAAINLIVLAGVWRLFRRVRRGGVYAEAELDIFLAQRGLLGRVFRQLFRLVSRSWHMYPLGLLFGLGFDTATEIGLLGISAAQASKGLPVWSILVFPALFSAGMSLIDTTDGVLMLGAYRWAFVNPIRKLYYNLTVTAVSVIVAAAIGGIEALGLVADRFGFEGRVWRAIGAANDQFGALGFAIVGIFVATWAVSFIVYRVKGYDKLNA
jgi:high-affinity nickel-transport protein